jgi:hypothetical protein
MLGLVALASALAGCGTTSEDQQLAELRAQLRTPPPYIGADPLPPPEPTIDPATLRDPKPTAKDAARLKVVIAGWADAIRRNDTGAAGEYFVLPAIVFQPTRGAVEVDSSDVLAAWHNSLPCGARLRGVHQNGRYVVGTFELTARPGHTCDTPGQKVRAAFVFGDPTHPKRFTEWWQVQDGVGAAAGPESRPAAPQADASSFGP